MTDYLEIRALVIGIINCDNTTKQEIGRRFAVYLGLEPGPLGSDDGIDGIGLHNERKIHFQCRLKGEELDKDDARAYYSDIEYHRVDVSMMLAGIGYKDTFTERLYGHGNISRYKIHPLTLGDLFEESPAFQEALKDLPRGVISAPAKQLLILVGAGLGEESLRLTYPFQIKTRPSKCITAQ